ncbi:hypothetical protein FB451DRAFT_189334 [Mycena latifolia]|nr:hypothetical protein FB451DRAFT_189334 [Mycena latifolia]
MKFTKLPRTAARYVSAVVHAARSSATQLPCASSVRASNMRGSTRMTTRRAIPWSRIPRRAASRRTSPCTAQGWITIQSDDVVSHPKYRPTVQVMSNEFWTAIFNASRYHLHGHSPHLLAHHHSYRHQSICLHSCQPLTLSITIAACRSRKLLLCECAFSLSLAPDHTIYRCTRQDVCELSLSAETGCKLILLSVQMTRYRTSNGRTFTGKNRFHCADIDKRLCE